MGARISVIIPAGKCGDFTGTINGNSRMPGDFIDFSACFTGLCCPCTILGWESIRRFSDSMEISASLLQSLQNSLLLAAGVTLVVTFISLIVAWYARASAISGAPEARRTLMKVASLGYAVRERYWPSGY